MPFQLSIILVQTNGYSCESATLCLGGTVHIAILLLHYTCMVLCGERHAMHMYAEY